MLLSCYGTTGTSAPLDAVWVHNTCAGAGGAPDESPRPDSGPAEAEELEKEGEAAVGLEGPKESVTVPSGRKRIPDAIDTVGKFLIEAKNTAKQYLTAQLRDYLAYVKSQDGWKMKPFVRPSTKLSGPLKAAKDAKEIIVDYIPGAK